MKTDTIVVRIADRHDEKYAVLITKEMALSAKLRGSGISRRSPAAIVQKMKDGKAVIALTKDAEWVGFSYIETWGEGEFVSNSGLIVAPAFRGLGFAKSIKEAIFELCRVKYPDASIFSITTGLAIMKMNEQLGFDTVTFNEITKDKAFWQGCKSCVNYSILQSKKCKNCLCTAMLYTPRKADKQPHFGRAAE